MPHRDRNSATRIGGRPLRVSRDVNQETFCVETFAGCPVAALDLPMLASHAAMDHSEMATLS